MKSVTVLADDRKYRIGKKTFLVLLKVLPLLPVLLTVQVLLTASSKLSTMMERNSTLNPVNTDELFIKASQKDGSEGETLVYMLADTADFI